MSRVARHLQHQGRRREDLGRGQPRLPRRARTARATLLWDLDPQGASTYLLPRQAEGQGRRAQARARQERRRRADQGHRPRAARPAAGRLLLPPHGPRARRDEAPDAAAGARARAARRRVRLRVPRLPAEHLARVRERVRGGRRAARAADPGDAVLAHLRAAARRSSPSRRPAGARVLLDGRRPQAAAPRGDGAAWPPSTPASCGRAIPAAARRRAHGRAPHRARATSRRAAAPRWPTRRSGPRSATASPTPGRSGLHEGEQVGVDRLGLGRRHPCGKPL